MCLAWLVFVVWLGLCLLFGAIALPYWGAATHCKNKKNSTLYFAGIMSNTGLEEKVGKMNVEEKEAKGQKGSEKTKGEKKKREDLSAFPLEVSELMVIYARLHVCVTPSNLSLIFQVFGKNGSFTFSTVLPVLLGMSHEKAHH